MKSPFNEIQQLQEEQREGWVPEHKPAVATPRTNHEGFTVRRLGAEIQAVPAQFARQLERELAELNQRLIDRQESNQAQLIRIEAGWREELRGSQAQVLALREALETTREAYAMTLIGMGESEVLAVADAALSGPPLPVVPLEDVIPLLDALKIIFSNPGSIHGETGIFDSLEISRGAIAKFQSQHSLP